MNKSNKSSIASIEKDFVDVSQNDNILTPITKNKKQSNKNNKYVSHRNENFIANLPTDLNLEIERCNKDQFNIMEDQILELSDISRNSLENSEFSPIFDTHEYPEKFIGLNNFDITGGSSEAHLMKKVLKLIEKHITSEENNVFYRMNYKYHEYFVEYYGREVELAILSKETDFGKLESKINELIIDLNVYIHLFIQTLNAYYELDYLISKKYELEMLTKDKIVNFICSIFFNKNEVYEIVYEMQRKLDQNKEEKYRKIFKTLKSISKEEFFGNSSKSFLKYFIFNNDNSFNIETKKVSENFAEKTPKYLKNENIINYDDFSYGFDSSKSNTIIQKNLHSFFDEAIELFKNIKFMKSPFHKFKIFKNIKKLIIKYISQYENFRFVNFENEINLNDLLKLLIYIAIHSNNISILTDLTLIEKFVITRRMNKNFDHSLILKLIKEFEEMIDFWSKSKSNYINNFN